MSMKKTVLAGTLLAAVSVVGGCGTTPEAPAVAASPPGAGNLSGSASAPMPTLSSDYPTFTSVKELAQASQLIVRGKVVSGPEKADEASQIGGDSENDICRDAPYFAHRNTGYFVQPAGLTPSCAR